VLVRSYRTVSPLPDPAPSGGAIGGLFSVALIRQIAPTWLSPAPCPVESRPSSTSSGEPVGAAVTRLTHRHAQCLTVRPGAASPREQAPAGEGAALPPRRLDTAAAQRRDVRNRC
jgi:hypothetical protein